MISPFFTGSANRMIKPQPYAHRWHSALRTPHLALLTVFAVMLAVSWRRWVSIIADSGRELDLPLRLLNGETLYRDVHFLYTPLAPYLTAQLYAWFGARLETLQASGVVCSVLIVWLCYRIARHLLTSAESALAVSGVIIFCIFKPTGNLISPYSYSALYGMVFALACLLACLRGRLIAAGCFLTLAVLAKQEFALVAGAAVLASAWQSREHKRRSLFVPVLVSLPLLAIASGWLWRRHGWDLLVHDCHLLFTNLPASLRYYNAQRTGLNAPLASLAQMLGGLAVASAIACAIVWASVRTMVNDLKRFALTFGTIALSLALLIGYFTRGQWDGSPLRALPLFLLALLWFARQKPEGSALFIIAAYSLAALLRVILRVPSGGAFGSFFLPTSLILLVYALVRSLPDAIARWSDETNAALRARRCGWTLLLAAFVCTAIVFGIRYRRTYSHLIETPRGTFHAPRNAGAAYGETLRWLQQHTCPDEAIAVFPEGSDLAFFSERRMPLRHQIYIPGLVSERDQTRVIEQLRDVRYVLIVNRPMREFGATAFGQDFYQRIGTALQQDYRVVHVSGAPDETNLVIGDSRFFIKVLERKTP